MRNESLSFLKSILTAPSPSGYEQPVQRLWRDYTRPFADEVSTDRHGNTIGSLNPDGAPRVMLAGHSDELGFLVNYINDDGYIYFVPAGGFDVAIIPGRRVLIHSADGPIKGVIGKRAIHLMSAEERSSPKPKIEDIWIDIGVKNKEEAQSLVTVGDCITYDVAYEDLRNGLATSRGFDDKAGSFVVAEALRLLSERQSDLQAAVFSVSTVQEEVGLRGAHTSAYGVDPDVGVAVDVTHATDAPDMDKRRVGDVTLGGGPALTRGANISPVVYDGLVETAENEGISYQVEAYPRGTGTDANAIQLTRSGVATGLVSLPLRYMHTPVEMMALSDMEATAQLLANYCLSLTPETKLDLE
ncbi:MAG: M42 family metallopeptidase [Candidatus Latescibacteria bacterium]|nr:M42 family metallopeptidase [Candidatus Latescibacterota bacterium]